MIFISAPNSLLWFFAIFAMQTLSNPTRSNKIVSGVEWTDDEGHPIQAHGAGFIEVNGKWYWFGEDKTENNQAFLGISCYESSDLMNWHRHPNVLKPIPGSAYNGTMIVERPKVLFNKNTSTFVMYFHHDAPRYDLAKVGIATSKNIDHGWEFQKSFSPLNSESRDMSIFQDDDGSAYLTFASDRNANLKIAALSNDYLNVTELVYEWKDVFWEATGIIKNKGLYTMIYSKQNGWDPNPNSAISAMSLKGPWSAPTLIAPEDVKTYSSQNAWDLTVKGSETTSFIYMGDRWVKDALGTSRYVWLPLQVEGPTVKLQWADVWSIDVATGKIIVETGTTYDANLAEISVGQWTCGVWCSLLNAPALQMALRSVVGTRAPAENMATFRQIKGSSEGEIQWCSIYYVSPGDKYVSGTISANGGSSSPVSYPPTSAMISIPAPIQLMAGDDNLIQITIPTGVTLKKIVVY